MYRLSEKPQRSYISRLLAEMTESSVIKVSRTRSRENIRADGPKYLSLRPIMISAILARMQIRSRGNRRFNPEAFKKTSLVHRVFSTRHNPLSPSLAMPRVSPISNDVPPSFGPLGSERRALTSLKDLNSSE